MCCCDDPDIESVPSYEPLMSYLNKVRLKCPFKECGKLIFYSDFFQGYESSQLFNEFEGLGSWPLPDSHLYACESKPIRCNKCKVGLTEREMQRHRQRCFGTTSDPTVEGGATNEAITKGKGATPKPQANESQSILHEDPHDVLLRQHIKAEKKLKDLSSIEEKKDGP